MAFNSMAVINGGDPNYLLLGCPRKLVKGEDKWIVTPIYRMQTSR